MKKSRLTALLLVILLFATSILAACAPAAPTAEQVATDSKDVAVTADSITLAVPAQELEYALFLGEEQKTDFITAAEGKVTFTQLKDNTIYIIKARVPAEGQGKASASVDVISAKTKEIVSAPTKYDFVSCAYTVTTNSISITIVKTNLQYALTYKGQMVGNYVTPPASKVITFSNLTPGEEYELIARNFSQTQESAAFSFKTFTTLAIPAAPLASQLTLSENDLTKGLESLSLIVPSNSYEYCVKQNGEFVKGWKTASEGVIVFDGLKRGAQYDIYARVPAVKDKNVYSDATLVISFATSANIDVEEEFNDWLDRQFLIEMYASNTISVHYTLKDTKPYDDALRLIASQLESELGEKIGQIYGIDDVRMYDIDISGLEDTSNADLQSLLDEVLVFDDAMLNSSQRLIKAILVRYLQTNMTDESVNLNYYGTYLDTSSGVQSNMPINFAEYTFYNELDVQIYLKLLAELDTFFQQCIDYEMAREQKGLGISDDSLDAAIAQCEAFLQCTDKTTVKNYLITTFDTRIDALGLSAAKTQSYKAQNIAVFNSDVMPAYQLFINELPKFKTGGAYDYKGQENEMGLFYFEHGKEYYEYLIKYSTGSTESIDSMYSRLTQRMRQAIGVYMDKMKNDAAYKAFQNWSVNADADGNGILSEQELIGYAYGCIDGLKAVIASKFPAIPDNEYKINLVEKALEATLTSAAFYMIPPIDDYLNNVIYINEANSDVSTLFSLLAHEGFPGHLYQNVYHFNTNPHELRSIFSFNGYAEGWASYVENLAYGWIDYGQYDAEIEALNQSWDTWVLCILCAADIGVNYYGWTFAQFEQFMNENSLNASKDTYNFFIASPGTYVKYGIGYLEISDMRTYAEKELGAAFNEIDFHASILDVGPAQFDLVWDAVKDYVSLAKAKAEAGK